MEQSPSKSKKHEKWYQRQWRPICAFLYLSICVFDFIIMPSIYVRYNEIDKVFLEDLKDLPVEVQSEFIRTILAPREWTPLTLQGGGLFHLSFGAILTGAATTRGLEKIETIRNEREYMNGNGNGSLH